METAPELVFTELHMTIIKISKTAPYLQIASLKHLDLYHRKAQRQLEWSHIGQLCNYPTAAALLATVFVQMSTLV